MKIDFPDFDMSKGRNYARIKIDSFVNITIGSNLHAKLKARAKKNHEFMYVLVDRILRQRFGLPRRDLQRKKVK